MFFNLKNKKRGGRREGVLFEMGYKTLRQGPEWGKGRGALKKKLTTQSSQKEMSEYLGTGHRLKEGCEKTITEKWGGYTIRTLRKRAFKPTSLNNSSTEPGGLGRYRATKEKETGLLGPKSND